MDTKKNADFFSSLDQDSLAENVPEDIQVYRQDLHNSDEQQSARSEWKFLIIDDDKSCYSVNRMALQSLTFKNRKLSVLNALSTESAKKILSDNPDIAIVLLNVGPEAAPAGMDLIHYIREELQNSNIRILLCSQQAGVALESNLFIRYDIDDYRIKPGLSKESLHTLIKAGLRTFDIMTMAQSHCDRLAKELETKTNELQLKTNELLKLNKAFETTEVGITITDTNQRIVYTNPADAKMHGFTVEELIGQPSNIFALKKPSTDKHYHKDYFETYVNWKRDGINIRKDGSTFPVTLISNVIKNSEGKNIGMVVACEDITERKKAELELKSSEQRLREINATKDKFFSIIGHDLKNPLTALMGYSELIVQRYDALSSEMLKEMIQAIRDSSQQLYKLTENLLEWSRVQSGKISFKPCMVDLHTVVNDNITLLKANTDAKQITIKSAIAAPTMAYVDLDMVNTIFRNLISNAIKFTEPGGCISFAANTQGEMLEVLILDNGVGIAPATLDLLFRIDVSHSTRGTKNEGGTGLGLILCKDFMDLHRGRITVESEQGKGSTFRLTFPVSRDQFNSLEAPH
jgi:PAS domain S-box-containing protein